MIPVNPIIMAAKLHVKLNALLSLLISLRQSVPLFIVPGFIFAVMIFRLSLKIDNKKARTKICIHLYTDIGQALPLSVNDDTTEALVCQ